MDNGYLPNKLINSMKQAGFSELASSIYCFLLSRESATSDEIISYTRQNDQYVRGALGELLRIRVIAVDVHRNKYVLYALDPDVVWGAFATEIIWRFFTTLEDYRSERLNLTLPANNIDAVLYARNLINAIREISISLYQDGPTPAVTKHRWREAIDREHMAVLLSEAILQASVAIRAVSKPPRTPQLVLIWRSIVNRIADGVAYHRITTLNEVMEHGLYVVNRDIREYGIDLRIVDPLDVEHKFYIVDNKYVVVYHLTGADQDQQIGRVTTEKNTIKRYRKRFGEYGKRSVPGSFVVDVLRDASEKMLNAARKLDFDEVELNWLQCLINWGIFCKIEDPKVDNMANLERRALQHGLITYTTAGQPIPDYGVNISDIQMKWAETQGR